MCGCRHRRYPHRLSVSLRNISRFSKRKRLRLDESSAVDPGQGEDVYCRGGGRDVYRKCLTSADGSLQIWKYGRVRSWEMREVAQDTRNTPIVCDLTSRECDFRFLRRVEFPSRVNYPAQFFLIHGGFLWNTRRYELQERECSLPRTYSISHIRAFTIIGFVRIPENPSWISGTRIRFIEERMFHEAWSGRASEKSGAVYFGTIGASVFQRNAQSNAATASNRSHRGVTRFLPQIPRIIIITAFTRRTSCRTSSKRKNDSFVAKVTFA